MLGKMLLSTAIALSVATPASAGWQFTEWGMNQEDLLTASPINIRKSQFDPECPSTAPLASNWEAGDMNFTACYGFDKESDTLSYVFLYLRDYAESSILYDALVARYGTPKVHTKSQGIGLIWYKWRDGDSSITLFDDKSNLQNPKAYINYRSLQPDLETENKL